MGDEVTFLEIPAKDVMVMSILSEADEEDNVILDEKGKVKFKKYMIEISERLSLDSSKS